jgi:DNA-binding LacI/PurR family transcriptional regulator
MVIVAPPVEPGDHPVHVAVDQRRGARLAVEHLVGLGHSAIAHLAGPGSWLDAAEREAGWRRALAEAGLPVGPLLPGDWSAASGYAAAQTLLAAPGPTAVFAANDLMAIGLVRGLTEGGLAVPAEVSVVGFDDIEVAGYALPPLTTVRQDFGALGRHAVRLLLAQLAGEERPLSTLVDPALVVRSSTAYRQGSRPRG